MKLEKNDEIPEPESLEAIDPFAAPPPGYSLAQDNQNYAWENPPEIADPEEALDVALDFLETPSNQREDFKLLTAGISIEVLVEGYVIEGFQHGKFSLDTGMLIKPPLAVYMVNLAEENGIAYRLFERDNPEEEEGMKTKEFLELMKINNPQMFEKIKEEVSYRIREGDAVDMEKLNQEEM